MVSKVVPPNIPLNIEDYPLIGTTNAAGVREFVPPRPKREIDTTQYVAPAVVFTSIPQPEMPELDNTFLGVPYGISQSLFEIGMYELAMLVDIGSHLGILGVPMLESEITEEVAPYLDALVVRKALNQFCNSRRGKHKYKKSTVVRDRLCEFLVLISPPNTYNTKEGKKAPETPLQVSSRGRVGEGRPKHDRLVRLPSEGEWDRFFWELIAMHTFTPEERAGKGVSKTLVRLADIRGSDAFAKYWPQKSLEILKSKALFVGFFCAHRVFEADGSKGDFSSWEIAKQGAVCPKTAKKYLKELGVRVTPNDVIKTRMSFEDIPNLPANTAVRDKRKSKKLIPATVHLQDEDGNQFCFTISGGQSLMASGAKEIFMAFYPMSTYDGSSSPFNPYHVNPEESDAAYTQTRGIRTTYNPGIQGGVE